MESRVQKTYVGAPRAPVAVAIAVLVALICGFLVSAHGVYALLGAVSVVGGALTVPVALRAVGFAAAPLRRLEPGGLTCGIALVAVFTLPANGLRLAPFIAFGDALLVLLAFLLALGALGAHKSIPTPPTWVVLGVMFLALSYLAYEFAPVTVRPEDGIFVNRNLLTGEYTQESGLRLLAQVVFALALAPYLLAAALSTRRRVEYAAAAWVAGSAVSALVAVLAAFTPFDYQEALTGAKYYISAFRSDAGRYSGLTVHGSTLGLTCAMALPMTLMFLADERKLRATTAAGVSGLFMVAIFVSGSRAALLAALVAVVVTGLLNGPARRKIAALCVAMTAVALTQASLIENLSVWQRLLGNTRSSQISDAAHSSRLSEAIDLWFSRPLTGYGFEVVRGAHNVLLQFLTAGGVIALAGFLSVALGAVSTAVGLRRSLDPQTRALAGALGASMAAWATASMVASSVFDRFLYLPVALLIALYFAERTAAASVERSLGSSYSPDR